MVEDTMLHEQLIQGISEQLKGILDSSEQAIYIYLDDIHKVCNQKFATLLGYRSPGEWNKVEGPFETFVDRRSQATLVANYNRAIDKMTASCFKVVWKKKNGGTVDTNVILAPIAYGDHLFAIHFIS
jgi:PAS domain-containing protein